MERIAQHDAYICDLDQIKAGKQHPRKVRKALRLMGELAKYLKESNMSLHVDQTNHGKVVLLSEGNGVYLGLQSSSVWRSGDSKFDYKNGALFESKHPNAGNF